MSHINEKLGLKPAGQRSMMKLPADRALRNRITAAQCPQCQQRGARPKPHHPGWVFCSWCAHTWELPADA
jgi:hypothetical protein